jgi:hypothetical protein
MRPRQVRYQAALAPTFSAFLILNYLRNRYPFPKHLSRNGRAALPSAHCAGSCGSFIGTGVGGVECHDLSRRSTGRKYGLRSRSLLLLANHVRAHGRTLPAGGALLLGIMGGAGNLSVALILPIMGKIYDVDGPRIALT